MIREEEILFKELLGDIQKLIVLMSAYIEPHTKGADYLEELKKKYMNI